MGRTADGRRRQPTHIWPSYGPTIIVFPQRMVWKAVPGSSEANNSLCSYSILIVVCKTRRWIGQVGECVNKCTLYHIVCKYCISLELYTTLPAQHRRNILNLRTTLVCLALHEQRILRQYFAIQRRISFKLAHLYCLPAAACKRVDRYKRLTRLSGMNRQIVTLQFVNFRSPITLFCWKSC